MSKAIGIVAEYNPFHNGHAHHLREAKRIAGNRPVIAAMSGSLVQRGLPALTDKWTRARMAVLGGVDLVLELPTVFTCRSAEFFAAGAVKLLAATGMVSHLAFGAEAANSQQLMLTAEFLNEPVFQDALHHYLDEGHSYAKSLELTLAEDPSMLTIAEHPNNILALEYCRQLLHGGYEIEPVVVKRRGIGYKDKTINGPIAGATAIREHYRGYGIDEALLSTVPATTAQLLREADLQHRMDISDKILNHLLLYKLRSLTPAQIAAACQCSEGLENRLAEAASCTTFQDVVSATVTKRYPASRVRRLLMQLLLQQYRAMFDNAKDPAYIRVLAFNDRGRELLKEMQDSAQLPVIIKLGRNVLEKYGEKVEQQLSVDIAATNLLTLLQKNHQPQYNNDYTVSPIYIQK